ncbi:hypothetical protein BDZ97DRAFT_1916954 [Flammula alnicola]|nr:hypothetical protein BDZ97DRAFT_1916954 [Flammula alnicola]
MVGGGVSENDSETATTDEQADPARRYDFRSSEALRICDMHVANLSQRINEGLTDVLVSHGPQLLPPTCAVHCMTHAPLLAADEGQRKAYEAPGSLTAPADRQAHNPHHDQVMMLRVLKTDKGYDGCHQIMTSRVLKPETAFGSREEDKGYDECHQVLSSRLLKPEMASYLSACRSC